MEAQAFEALTELLEKFDLKIKADAETAGIKTYEYPDLPGVFGYSHQFIKDGQLYRQLMHAMPADWSNLKILLNSFPGAEAVSIGADGLIFARINSTEHFGCVDSRVNPVEINQVLLDVAYLFNREDVNGDGRDDYIINYLSQWCLAKAVFAKLK